MQISKVSVFINETKSFKDFLLEKDLCAGTENQKSL
jgi:hypothetical protein